MDRTQFTAEAVAAAKAAPPSAVAAATILGYPVEHLILWLTLLWWIWLFIDKISEKLRERRAKRRK